MKAFFAWSGGLDHLVLRPLSHIHSNWELWWDHESSQYEHEHDSFAEKLNLLIDELADTKPPPKYHDSEDRLARHVVNKLNWNIRKEDGRWIGADYAAILEQGGFNDISQRDLVSAAAGRIRAALARGQMHIDQMEEFHARMLGALLSIILFHRSDEPPFPAKSTDED